MEEGLNITKTQTTSAQNSQTNVFLFGKVGQNPTKYSVHVEFQDGVERDALKNSLPLFNSDRQFYTPAFVLSADQDRIQNNRGTYQQQFMKKINQIATQKQQIFVAQPSKLNRYCCLCHEPYDDYLTHIHKSKHQQLMKESKYNSYIHQLCDQIHNQPEPEDSKEQTRVAKKNKKIQKKNKKSDKKKQLSFQLRTSSSTNINTSPIN